MDDLIPIIGMLLVLGPPAAFLFSLTPIGKAITQRIKGQTLDDPGQLEEMHHMLLDMNDAVEHMESEVEELRDRLTFAERLLTAGEAQEEKKVETPV
jgi:hypothetical protein